MISDLYEVVDLEQTIARAANLVSRGVNMIILLALSDTGTAAYGANAAGRMAALGIPVFGVTPDQFPDLMAIALRRWDVEAWAASEEIATIRPA